MGIVSRVFETLVLRPVAAIVTDRNRIRVPLRLSIIMLLTGGSAFGTLLATRVNAVPHAVENSSEAAHLSDTFAVDIEPTSRGRVSGSLWSGSVGQTDFDSARSEYSGSVMPERLWQVSDAVSGLHALAAATARWSQTVLIDSETHETAELAPSTAPVPEEVPTEIRPPWLDHPDEKQTVVQTAFEESPGLVQSQLEREMTRRLLEDAMDIVGGETAVLMPKLSRVSMTSGAVESSIEDRYSEEVILKTADGVRRMFRTSVLVRFTEAIKLQAVRHIQRSVEYQRTWTVGVTASALGLVVMLAAALLQMAGSSSRLVRWSGIPLVAVLMLLSVAGSSLLINRVIASESTQIPSPFEMPETVIGAETGGESFVD